MIIGLILHGRPTVMRRLLIRSKRRVLIASDYLERTLAPGRASTRQRWQGATDRDRSRPLVPCREVVSRNRNERSGCSRVDTGNWARTGRDRSRPVRKIVVWTSTGVDMALGLFLYQHELAISTLIALSVCDFCPRPNARWQHVTEWDTFPIPIIWNRACQVVVWRVFLVVCAWACQFVVGKCVSSTFALTCSM